MLSLNCIPHNVKNTLSSVLDKLAKCSFIAITPFVVRLTYDNTYFNDEKLITAVLIQSLYSVLKKQVLKTPVLFV
ncbi:hypothetical protein bcgnr5387_62520 [Bacillus luti]|nr:hypothetical protein BC2903_31160 [Bacillus cereus]